MGDIFEEIADALPAYEDTKLKFTFIGRLLWRPFDTQYQDLLRRLRQHKEIFELEVSLASAEEIMRRMDKYEKEVLDAERKPRQEEVERNQEEVILSKRASTLKKWVRPPGWMESFERAQSLRSRGTGRWILESKEYQDWRKINQQTDSTLGSKMLSIQAKPGYGKTVLCSTIIEDLGSYVLGSDSAAGHRSHSVVFYFFDKRSEAANGPIHALRAMLGQLIHLHRANQQVIDMASVLFIRQDTGEFAATDNEVIAVLEVLLDQLKFTYLVFDALDECSNYPELFKRLEQIATKSRTCAVLVLGRPSVKLPVRLRHDCLQLQPQSSDQDKDMVRYLQPQLTDLIEDELFPETLPVEETISKIIERANGMFLWTRLLMEYLRLPSLTTRDRVDALDHLNRLEGLDSMYRAIMSGLEKQFPGASVKSVCRLFQLVAYSERLLELDELRCAISVPLDSKQTEEDQVPNLERVMGSLSGSLIELSADSKAQFIHLSTKEFFWEASGSDTDAATAPNILTSQPLANRNIAASCLSYLIHTVRPEPLAGSSLVVPDRVLCRQRYPLLSYAATYWSVHLGKALTLSLGRKESLKSGDASWSMTAQLIKTFLTQKRTIMMWIEASWLFKSHPEVIDITEQMLAPSLSQDCPPEVLSSLEKSIGDLRDLSSDLITLHKSWSFILRKQPNEIWEPSIPAFTKSRFWMSSLDACVSRIPFDMFDRKGFIILQSRLAHDGTEMGIVKLFPTQAWLQSQKDESNEPKRLACAPDTPGAEWKATYELWSLASNTLLQSFEIVLQGETISPFVTFPGSSQAEPQGSAMDRGLRKWEEELRKTEPTVSIPLDISDDLRRIIALDVAVAILPVEAQGLSNHTRDGGRLRYQRLDLNRRQPIVHIRRDKAQLPGFEDFYHLKFSRSNEFFVLVRASTAKATKDGVDYGVMWLLQVFHDENFGRDPAGDPKYSPLAATTFFAVPEIALLSPVRGITFHPWLPCLAFPQVLDGRPQTYVWRFRAPAVLDDGTSLPLNPAPVHEPPIVDVVYSDDGRYLYGTQAPFNFGSGVVSEENMKSFSKPIIVRAPDYNTTPLLLPSDSGLPSSSSLQSSSSLPPSPSLPSSSSLPVRLRRLQDRLATAVGSRKGKEPMPAAVAHADHHHDHHHMDLTAAEEEEEENRGQGAGSRDRNSNNSSLAAFRSAAVELASGPRPPVQRMNALAFAGDGAGVAHISQLQQLERAGAVVLTTLGTDGRLRSETLSRLPFQVTRCVDVSIVTGEEEREGEEGEDNGGGEKKSDTVRIVLDKARRRGLYSLRDVDDVALPAVIERSRASIPTFVATVPLGQVFQDVPGESHTRGLIKLE
ncbi:hypothetical protein Daus18300_003580 [Diaporthe australafricana]|uniref:Nephrocystin 3-like N-terminal domain-containing protein n=1 Tax=Diaporthe australafricana TaxID=127596 RepID=A0ABR3XF56_9PEZI